MGTDLMHALEARGHQVVASDVRPAPASGLIKVDVTDAASVHHWLKVERPDAVYHLAAILSARGEEHPVQAYQVNQGGTWNVFSACWTLGIRRIIYASTIAVYGPGLPDPTPEDVALAPTTMYGATKAAGELLAHYFNQKRGMEIRVIRFPGLISASEPGGGSSDYALYMYVDGVRKGAYEAFCRPDTRIPLMYMPDALRALVDVGEVPQTKLTRTVYNIAAFAPRADEIAASVRRLLPHANFTFRPDPLRQSILDSWPRQLDDAAARRDWEWRPQYSLEQMTDDLIARVRELPVHT